VNDDGEDEDDNDDANSLMYIHFLIMWKRLAVEDRNKPSNL
jgi:hypothetical protein